MEEINYKIDDYLVHALAKQDLLRCVSVRTTKLVREAQKIHDLSPASTVALGRLMSAALLMSSDLKNPENQLTVLLKSDGEISGMTVIADQTGQVRGDINNPHAVSHYRHEGKLDLGQSIGKGNLTVIKDLGLKEPYVGSVELISGEIAEDIAAYYFYSEQIPSVVFLGVRLNPEGVVAAGGMMIQALPGADDALLDWLEARTKGYPDISELLAEAVSPHQLIDLLLGDDRINYLKAAPVRYFCPCNAERMEQNLLTLSKKDLLELADDPAGINLHCHFCERDYHFSQDQIKKLLKENIGEV